MAESRELRPPRIQAGGIEIGLGLDVQDAYEDGMALARAWLAFCAELERSGRVVPSLRAERALRAMGFVGGGRG